MAIVALGVALNTIYAKVMVEALSMPVEIVAVTFAAVWPLVSFSAMRLWAFR